MSERTTRERPDPDELASAYLDGDLDAATRATVDADPELLLRVDELAAVRRAVAGPTTPPPPGAEVSALAAALAVHDQLWAQRPAPVPEKRRWWERLSGARIGPVLAGASLVAIAAVGVVAAIDDGDSTSDGDQVAATVAPTSVAAASETAPSEGGEAPAPLQAAAPAPFLGSVADDADLQPLLRELPAAPEEVVAAAEADASGDVAGADADGAAEGATASGETDTTSGEAASPPGAGSSVATDAGDTDAAPAPAAAADPPAASESTYPPVSRTAGATCPAPDDTVFYGTLEVEGDAVEVFVGVDRAVALAVDGCTVQAEVPLP